MLMVAGISDVSGGLPGLSSDILKDVEEGCDSAGAAGQKSRSQNRPQGLAGYLLAALLYAPKRKPGLKK